MDNRKWEEDEMTPQDPFAVFPLHATIRPGEGSKLDSISRAIAALPPDSILNIRTKLQVWIGSSTDGVAPNGPNIPQPGGNGVEHGIAKRYWLLVSYEIDPNNDDAYHTITAPGVPNGPVAPNTTPVPHPIRQMPSDTRIPEAEIDEAVVDPERQEHANQQESEKARLARIEALFRRLNAIRVEGQLQK